MEALGRDWIALPNDAETALRLARRLDLGRLILTGGELSPVVPEIHRAQRHEIVFVDQKLVDRKRCMVNSFHNFAPAEESLARGPLGPLARCTADGTLEAAAAPGLLGLMWHPEREAAPAAEDLRLLGSHFL